MTRFEVNEGEKKLNSSYFVIFAVYLVFINQEKKLINSLTIYLPIQDLDNLIEANVNFNTL